MPSQQRLKNVHTTPATVVLLAGGRGLRVGGSISKQFRRLIDRPVLDWSLSVFVNHPRIETVVLVLPEEIVETKSADYQRMSDKVQVIAGGATRQQSVANALDLDRATLSPLILIHDAARPGITQAHVDDLLDALETFEGAAPAIPVSDALKLKSDSGLRSVDRENLFRIQTPQAFRTGSYVAAFQRANSDAVDDFEIAQAAGLSLTFTSGSERLQKVTYIEDFEIVAAMLRTEEKTGGSMTLRPRIGFGYDVHAFEPGAYLMLCGVEIPHTHKLKGHSDADVGWHALTDAILGALALGDIGDHFPPSDPQWSGAPSIKFLEHAVRLASDAGAQIEHVDLTLICEAPKIKPHREAMCEATAECLGIDVSRVSVKATTTEQLGFTGRREGMAAQAVATLLFPSGAIRD